MWVQLDVYDQKYTVEHVYIIDKVYALMKRAKSLWFIKL